MNICVYFNHVFRMEHYRDESLNHNPHNTVSMNFMRERPDHGPPPPLKKPKLLNPISPQPPLKIDISVCFIFSCTIIIFYILNVSLTFYLFLYAYFFLRQ